MANKIYTLEAPDEAGKTTIGVALHELMNIPYYTGKRYPIDKDTDPHTVKMAEIQQFTDLVELTRPNLIVDRFHLSELAYSMTFGRKINEDYMIQIDKRLAKAGMVIIYLDTPLSIIKERLAPFSIFKNYDLLSELKSNYAVILNWTKCPVIKVNPMEEGFDINNLVDRLERIE